MPRNTPILLKVAQKTGALEQQSVDAESDVAPRCAQLHPAVLRINDAWPNLPPQKQRECPALKKKLS
jgi:hypothetical protein